MTRLGKVLVWGIVSFSLTAASPGFATERARDPSTTKYSDVKTFLHKLAAKYPQTTQLFTLGDSDSGDTIEGVAIGNGPIHNMIVSTHHGNEYGSTEVARGAASALAANPIKGQTIYVIPVLNIAGYNAKDRRESAKGDAAGVDHDPNRDYPGPCGTEGPHLLKDTAAL
ncbi:MAG: M14 family zinc carboxypeptidase, partial [Bdellovibrionota bacterium]